MRHNPLPGLPALVPHHSYLGCGAGDGKASALDRTIVGDRKRGRKKEKERERERERKSLNLKSDQVVTDTQSQSNWGNRQTHKLNASDSQF